MAKKVWRCKMNCQMPWRDFVKGEMVELEDEEATPRVKALFECLTPEQVRAAERAQKPDADFQVMVQRLKAAKIPLKRGITKEEVKKLFDEFLGAQAEGVAGAVK